ncbi:MAG: iron ABC transporter permease [Pelagibacteraceae bacterium]|nr:iron ABC transporter permease [Pelagibacteraceae bacterium]PHX89395.1 MAG: iron ABC transporter [Pelagibacteraceae bacterium]
MEKRINIWYLSSLIISIIVAIPVVVISSSFFENTSEYSIILRETFLLDYIFNSLILLIGVLSLTSVIGIGCAYLISFYDFTGANFFKWALILSFAIPAYIYSYSLSAFFENYGTAYSILRGIFGEGNHNLYIPKLDGMLGAIIAISFSIFGYVYVLTRVSFHYQSQNLIDLGKNLGFSKKKTFLKIILPAARPSIVAGLSLVAMETLSDFGSVSFFGVSTLTTGIYNAWIAFDDLTLANRLSFYLLIFIFGLLILENISRQKAQYHSPSKDSLKTKNKIKLYGYKSAFAFIFCFLVFFISFIFPVVQMGYWTYLFPKYLFELNLINLLSNTLILVFFSCSLLIAFGILSNYGNRITKSKFLQILTTFSISGYAMPGIILAVAYITFISYLDENLLQLKNYNIKSLFIGSIFGLILVYFIRFYSLANNGIKAGYLKINYSIDESAYLLGYSKIKTFNKIHLPYLKNSIFLVIILLSIEIVKELPITLIMRPFNFDTFATTAYAYASQDLLEAAAAPAIMLILISSAFILITSKLILKDQQ